MVSERDERGRWRAGVSGNPTGRGAGRPPESVNRLADEGLVAVLLHDLSTVRRAAGELLADEKRPTVKETQSALDRLARTCGRRITTSAEVMAQIGEASLRRLVEIIIERVPFEQQEAVVAELDAVLGWTGQEKA